MVRETCVQSQVIPKTQEMVLDAALLSTQHYKVRINGKVELSWEWSSAFFLHLSVVAIEKGAFGSPLTKVANLLYTIPMNINGYVPILINTSDSIIRVGNMPTKWFTLAVGYLLHAAGEYCILLML